MGTRASLKALVLDKLPNATKIPSVDHREVEDAIIDQMFDDNEAQDVIIQQLLDALPINTGLFYSLDVGNATQQGTNLTVDGDCTSALVDSVPLLNSFVTVIMANDMNSDTDYDVFLSVRSKGDFNADNDILTPVYKIIDKNTFRVGISRVIGAPTDLEITFKAYNR
tara:strand:- start:7682 stop:8182 length:501 start_codon:yes stop_codon:yes gene_type:complete